MKFWAYLSIVFSFLMILFSLVITIVPGYFSNLNSVFQTTSFIIPFLSMLFSLFALLIASFAFLKSIKKPNLRLSILSYQSEKEGPILAFNAETNTITDTRPLSFWNLWVNNSGDSAARYPVIELKFHGMHFREDAFPGWLAVHHDHGLGWYGFQWAPEDRMIIHPHFPVKLPNMYFKSVSIQSINPEVIITIVADGFKAKKVVMPIELVK